MFSTTPSVTSPYEITRLRGALLIGGVLVSIFVFADLILLPESLYTAYLINRFGLQLPLVVFALALTWWHKFNQIKETLFAVILVMFTYVNYGFLHYAWVTERFSFAYEGTILYTFYCIFALGVPFRLSLIAAVINVVGFILLMYMSPVYGERVMLAVGFVASSLFVGCYARYRLDHAMALLKSTNARLVVLSTRDELTGLLNRRALMEGAEYLLSLCKREKLTTGVIMADLDDFKKYNDAFGHQQGDEAIMMQAGILNEVFQRKSDVVGRYGGEEFMVMVSGLNEQEVTQQCEAVLNLWQERALPHAHGASHPVMGCSIGAVVSKPDVKTSLQALISQADKNLYEAKHRGRQTFYITCMPDKS
ncbi:GGDEF domain-containing protein [Alteromonas sp. ASW11-19]|uniref:diguanylate cyclase n=1 Tax=Alteromonas salexigens TaxID=2982530 RepID=A0ABT2VJG3_9ALTE|nr:GGDEF domain-containing protein [Alteromonas salexigens]MCU7553370.1 GGDEF domain-containing protein [Alteromonas salexigens]